MIAMIAINWNKVPGLFFDINKPGTFSAALAGRTLINVSSIRRHLLSDTVAHLLPPISSSCLNKVSVNSGAKLSL